MMSEILTVQELERQIADSVYIPSDAQVIMAALFKKIYGRLPCVGLSCEQVVRANELASWIEPDISLQERVALYENIFAEIKKVIKAEEGR